MLAVTQVSETGFLVSAGYQDGDLVTYLLDITDPEQREAMREAQGQLRNGMPIIGQARRPPMGVSAADMEFGFSAAPQLVEK